MGCTQSSETSSPQGAAPHLVNKAVNLIERDSISVATLNYCGIMYSPFEFYSEEYKKELENISSIFTRLLPNYLPDFNPKEFKWTMGKLDLKFKIGRYSPMFRLQTGVEDGHFLNQEQFSTKWKEKYEANMSKAKDQFPQEYQDLLCLYDFIMFHSLLDFVFG